MKLGDQELQAPYYLFQPPAWLSWFAFLIPAIGSILLLGTGAHRIMNEAEGALGLVIGGLLVGVFPLLAQPWNHGLLSFAADARGFRMRDKRRQWRLVEWSRIGEMTVEKLRSGKGGASDHLVVEMNLELVEREEFGADSTDSERGWARMVFANNAQNLSEVIREIEGLRVG